jgi:thiamine biosynthesis lipoprotein
MNASAAQAMSEPLGDEMDITPTLRLTPEPAGYRLSFHAMACPCEVRVELADRAIAEAAGRAAEAEAVRIERKFSRYRDDSVVTEINRNGGHDVSVDPETAQLLDFAAHFHELSRGKFDITSGVLRRIWRFDGGGQLPSACEIRAVRQFIGWDMVRWHNPVIRLRPGMEIDFGGIGKEYAVDRALAAVRQVTPAPVLVNFGGDLRVSGARAGGERWKVAIESTDRPGTSAGIIEIAEGALATSGDARHFLIQDGKRYGHILDPTTGRPVALAPRSVTVAAATCIEAGMLATLAILQGRRAERFLEKEKVRAWCIR